MVYLVNTVYMWVRQGKLGAYQTPGRTNLIRPSDLVHFMQENGMFVPTTLSDLARRDEKLNSSQLSTNSGEADDDRDAILVVDDDPVTRSLVVRALNDDFHVVQAETGYEALHLVTMNKRIFIVILDLRMPGQHGLETLNELKQLKPDLQVIVLSGFAEDLPPAKLSDGTVASAIQKPFTIQQLQAIVREVSERVKV